MKLGVMQPYLFPYIGYFQLINAVDVFVMYDDVAFIRSGWINRNRIKIDAETRYFTVPLLDASSFRLIRETMVAAQQYASFRTKLFSTIKAVYGRAPHYRATLDLIDAVLVPVPGNIGDMAAKSVAVVCEYLNLKTRIVPTSSLYGNAQLRKADRLIDICRREGADTYINSIGGVELYSKATFADAGIALWFLKGTTIEYQQCGAGAFLPNLSILDVMMNNPREIVRGFLDMHVLV